MSNPVGLSFAVVLNPPHRLHFSQCAPSPQLQGCLSFCSSLTDTWSRRSRTPASASSISGSPVVENRAPSASRVPTVNSRSSRSVTPGHQRLGLSLAFSGDSPSSIPLVKGHHRKTGTAVDSVPNTRRPPVVAASLSRKAGTGMAVTPKP